MDDPMSHAALTGLGLHIANATDLEQGCWLVRTAGADAVRRATHELTSRCRPRPRKVIQLLGLERRKKPRLDVAPFDAVVAHQIHRRNGWRTDAQDAAA